MTVSTSKCCKIRVIYVLYESEGEDYGEWIGV
jgi:hypothetical protein